MSALQPAFLIVAIILFLIAALVPIFRPTEAWHGALVNLGLAFFAASFLPIGG